MARKHRKSKPVVLVRLDADDATVDLGEAGVTVSLAEAVAAIEQAGAEGRTIWLITKDAEPGTDAGEGDDPGRP